MISNYKLFLDTNFVSGTFPAKVRVPIQSDANSKIIKIDSDKAKREKSESKNKKEYYS